MKVVVISCHTPSLLWFRLDMMKDLVCAGNIVIAVGNESERKWAWKFENEGINYRQIPIKRNSRSLIYDFRAFLLIVKFLSKERPDKIFAYQTKPILYSSIAASLCGINEIYSLVAGLGSVLSEDGSGNHLTRILVRCAYKISLKMNKGVIFQNYDDLGYFIDRKLVKLNHVHLVKGSGVNLSKFSVNPMPVTPVFIFIGRLIKDKGIYEYLEACKRIKAEYPDLRCLLVGPYDTNPSAIKPTELTPYMSKGIVEYFGEQPDVRPYLAQSSVLILPSYHEGIPKVVLEAMASGRAVITTTAPGCRDTVKDSVSGYLVPPRNINAIVEKMRRFIKDPGLACQMGEMGRQIAEREYDVHKVNQDILGIMDLQLCD